MNNVRVSIITLAYNHGSYIRQCLDGFIMQKTNFPFEVLIHDDASTDDTASIIREYQAKYPDIVKPIFQTENQYSKGVSIGKDFLYPRAQGDFIALCEGDDYWTDSLKLQKQFDWMEAHPECSLCFTNAVIHWYDGSHPDELFAQVEERDYSGVELCKKWLSPTASFFFRASILEEYISIRSQYPEIIIGDSPLIITCANNGTIHGIPDVCCVYGKHPNSWTQYEDATKTFLSARSWEAQRKAFGGDYREVMTNILTGQYLLAMYRGIKSHDYRISLKAFYRGVVRQPITAAKAIIKIVNKKMNK